MSLGHFLPPSPGRRDRWLPWKLQDPIIQKLGPGVCFATETGLGPLGEHTKKSVVGENPATLSSSEFPSDAWLHEQLHPRCGGRKRQIRASGGILKGYHRPQLEDIVNAERRSGPAASCLDAPPILFKKRSEPASRSHGTVGCLGHTLEKECNPRLPLRPTPGFRLGRPLRLENFLPIFVIKKSDWCRTKIN